VISDVEKETTIFDLIRGVRKTIADSTPAAEKEEK